MKKVKIIIIIMAAVIVIVLGVDAYLGYKYYQRLTHIEQVFREETFELGDVHISNDVSSYIRATEYMYKKAVLDTSAVNENTVGDYTIVCRLNKISYTYIVHIVDTTAPSFILPDNKGIYGTFNSYHVSDLISEAQISDQSALNGTELISCKNEFGDVFDITEDEYCFENAGTYTFEFKISDIYENIAYASTSIEVLESPHFVMLEDRQYRMDSPFDLLDFVYAYDRNGNDITDSIVIENADGFSLSKPDDYQVSYSVTDCDGLTRNECITVSVGYFDKNSFGFECSTENMELLVSHDFFRYKPLIDNIDIGSTVNLTQYASFGFKDETGYGATGFIYAITSRYVYFMTCKHCSPVFTKDIICLVDYNGNVSRLERSRMEVYTSSSDDIALLKIPIEDFDQSYLLTYKEVYIDWDIYDRMNIGDMVVVNTQEFGYHGFGTFEDRITTGTVIEFYTHTYYNITFDTYVLLITDNLIGGQSGTACFNTNGYFLGIAQAVLWAIDKNGSTHVANELAPLPRIKLFVETINFE